MIGPATEEAIAWFEKRKAGAAIPGANVIYDKAIASLRAQAEAEKNEPLTLEELFELDGNPAYAVCIESPGVSCWGFIIDDITNDFPGVFIGYRADFPVEDYGDEWLAYRRKPEEGIK